MTENAFDDSKYSLPEEARTPNLRTLAVRFSLFYDPCANLSIERGDSYCRPFIAMSLPVLASQYCLPFNSICRTNACVKSDVAEQEVDRMLSRTVCWAGAGRKDTLIYRNPREHARTIISN